MYIYIYLYIYIYTFTYSYIYCARRRCGRAHARVHPLVYVASAHVMYTMYVYISIDAKSGYVNGYGCVFLRTRAIACGR